MTKKDYGDTQDLLIYFYSQIKGDLEIILNLSRLFVQQIKCLFKNEN